MVMFGGYARECEMRRDPERTGGPDFFTAGFFCDPIGEGFVLGDTWHHNMDICPKGCSGRGKCHYGSCICDIGFYGYDCAQFTCPDCVTMQTEAVKGAECEVRDDNGVTVTLDAPPLGPDAQYKASNGTVIENCVYEYGWQRKTCRSCSLRGTCNHPTGKCVCDPMFSNFDCSYKACPHPSCNGGGKCLLEGSCVCAYSRFEEDCSISFNCPNDCTLRGYCLPGGTCKCYHGFIGEDCSLQTTVGGAQSKYAYGLTLQLQMCVTLVVSLLLLS